MKIEIKVPNLGESISEAVVCNIIKASGSFVEMDDEIIELETDKVNQTLNASSAGKLELNVNVDDTVKVGQVIGSIDTESKGDKSADNKQEKPLEPDKEQKVKKSDDEQLELKDKELIKPEESKKVATDSNRETRKRMTKLRRVVAERLVSAKNQTAMLTTFNEVNLETIIEFRSKEQAEFLKNHQVKLGFMSFFVKASILALKKYPEINAYIDQDEIVYRKYYDIGVAVGTEKGLLVPVIRGADQKSFAKIEIELKDLAQRARDNKISVDDLRGGSFTITNGGVYGSLLSTPILNPPQSGILGMHAIQKRPVVVDEQIVIKPMMYLALSYDHRLIDGKEAIGFLVEVKNHLEDPTRILVDL